MAADDTELKNEVRVLTEYGADLLPDSKLNTLLKIAKEEIRTEIKLDGAETTLDFYATKPRERALFWLTCLFSRINMGEYDND